jgi:hypothetical protein
MTAHLAVAVHRRGEARGEGSACHQQFVEDLAHVPVGHYEHSLLFRREQCCAAR